MTLAFRELLYLVVVLDWTPQLLRPRAASLLGETALPSGPGGCRRDTPSRDRERRAELRQEPLEGELSVPQLAALVLRDRSQNRA